MAPVGGGGGGVVPQVGAEPTPTAYQAESIEHFASEP